MKVNRLVAIYRPTAPQKGYEDDRVLQTFGFMNGDDLDQGLIILKAKLCVFTGAFLELFLKPA